MVRVLSLRFQQCFDLFTVLVLKGFPETDILDIYLTAFFGVRKFKNTSTIRVIFFWKMFEIKYKFRKYKKKLKKYFRFWDNCIWKCYYKLSLLRRDYLLSAVNGFTNSPKILHITQRDIFKRELPAQESINMVKVLCFWF